MKIIYIGILAILLVSITAAPAKKWLCKDLGNADKKGADRVCAKLEGEEYGVDPCDDGFYCPAHLAGDEFKCRKPDDDVDSRYPGDICDNDNQCYKNKCDGGVCDGKKVAEKCEDRGECNPNLYCHG